MTTGSGPLPIWQQLRCRARPGLEKGQRGFDFHRWAEICIRGKESAINRLLDKSQSEIPGNPLSQTSGDLSAFYPRPPASLPRRRYENCHMIAVRPLRAPCYRILFISGKHLLSSPLTLTCSKVMGFFLFLFFFCPEIWWQGVEVKMKRVWRFGSRKHSLILKKSENQEMEITI